jgi:hypothetical protein
VSEFVRGGGSLLVLDGIANSGSTANEVLAEFSMAIAVRPAGAFTDMRPCLEVLGGEPLAACEDGVVDAARQVWGAGRVVVAVDSYIYSEAGLGRPLQAAEAYAGCRSRYRRLFALLEEIR